MEIRVSMLTYSRRWNKFFITFSFGSAWAEKNLDRNRISGLVNSLQPVAELGPLERKPKQHEKD